MENIPGIESGPIWTQKAIDTLSLGFGSQFVAIALFFFAFTTLMAYAFYTESNVAYLFKKSNKAVIFSARVFLLVMTYYGSIRTATLAWGLGDIGVGLMAWLNIIAILMLGRHGLAVLGDYEARRKAGGLMEFDPDALGIGNAELWHAIRGRRREAAHVSGKPL